MEDCDPQKWINEKINKTYIHSQKKKKKSKTCVMYVLIKQHCPFTHLLPSITQMCLIWPHLPKINKTITIYPQYKTHVTQIKMQAMYLKSKALRPYSLMPDKCSTTLSHECNATPHHEYSARPLYFPGREGVTPVRGCVVCGQGRSALLCSAILYYII